MINRELYIIIFEVIQVLESIQYKKTLVVLFENGLFHLRFHYIHQIKKKKIERCIQEMKKKKYKQIDTNK